MYGIEATPFAAMRAVGVFLLLLLAPSACADNPDEAQFGGDAAFSRGGAERLSPSSGGEKLSETGSGRSEEDLTVQQDFDRKIVKTAELGIRSDDVRASAERAQQMAARYGGSVLSSQTVRGDGAVSADLVLLVPSPEFEKALGELRGLGKEVTTDTVRGEDVSEEFVDLESRERNLLAAEQSLLELYDRARDVSEALAIERELTDIRGQIEQVQGRIKYLEQRTATSQITLTIQPVVHPAPQAAWDPASVVVRAWSASLSVLQALATALLSIVVFGWWLAPVLVAGFVWRRRRNRDSSPAATGS